MVVISEAEEDAADALPDTSGDFWIGTGRRGLAVVALNGWCIEPAEVQIAERLFLPVRLSRGDLKLHVVGTCVKKKTDYVSPTLSALEQLGGFLRAGPAVVAGDFNQSVAAAMPTPNRNAGAYRRRETVTAASNPFTHSRSARSNVSRRARRIVKLEHFR